MRFPHRPGLPAAGYDRRSFLAAAGAALPAVWLIACGGDDGATAPTAPTTSGRAAAPDAPAGPAAPNIAAEDLPAGAAIVGRFPPNSLVPGAVRLPLSLDVGGALLTNGPATLTASITDQLGSPVADALAAPVVQHGPGTPQFWVVHTDLATPGIYDLRIAGVAAPKQFQVLDRGLVVQPKPGDPLPPVDTPTTTDPRGVHPICTRATGVCPLHEVTLTEALRRGRPVAYLVGTPAFCQFDVCGPMLDLLLAAHREHGDRITFVHADVYTDDTATTAAPAVQEYQLSWEPTLFVTDTAGTIVDRLDITYSAEELRAVLARAGA